MSDSPIPQRLCPDCKVPLERVKPRVTLSSHPGSMLGETMVVDIYSCPQCGLIRVYDYEQRWKQEYEAEKAAKTAAQPAPPPQPKEPVSGDPWDKPRGKGWNPFRSKD